MVSSYLSKAVQALDAEYDREHEVTDPRLKKRTVRTLVLSKSGSITGLMLEIITYVAKSVKKAVI